jgi:hypothetical protein
MEDAMNLRIIFRSIPLFLLLLITLILVLPSAQAPVKAASPVYVRPDGHDYECDGSVNVAYPGGTGPLSCAFQTFFKAHQMVDDGGIIYVGAGVYPGVFSIGKSVTVIGAGVDQTIIDRAGAPQGILIDHPIIRPTVIISDLTIQNSVNTGPGGGVVIWNADVTLQDCVIQNNSALSGGGIENWGDLTVERCTISGNVATGNFGGGGIYNLGTLVLIDSSVVNNHADFSSASGGGILNNNNDPGEYVHIIRTTLSGNSADNNGSALKDQGDRPVWLANVTVTDNMITSGDGTIMITAGKTTDIWNSTIAGNHAGGPGVEGGIMTASTLILANTILADNDNSNCYITGAGMITTTGLNIDSGSTCGFTAGPNMPNTDPLLGPLADNGGYSETMALLPGSPAIDAGYGLVCLMFPVDGVDQRGVARPIGFGCDIGAYEAPMWLFLPLIMR